MSRWNLIGLFLLALAGVNRLHATPTITVSDGVNTPVVYVNSSGMMSFSTNTGVWNLVSILGAAKPAAGSANNPLLSLGIQATSTGAGTLTITLSDNNYGPAGTALNLTFSGHLVGSTTEASVTNSVYSDPGNVTGGQSTLLGRLTGALSSYPATNRIISLTAPGSIAMTEVVKITATGPTAISINAGFQPVTLPLLKISPTTTNTAVLSWTNSPAGFTLQSSSTLTGPNWSAVTKASNLVGGNNQVVVPLTNQGGVFYRLNYP